MDEKHVLHDLVLPKFFRNGWVEPSMGFQIGNNVQLQLGL
jgi:hypothetical protein